MYVCTVCLVPSPRWWRLPPSAHKKRDGHVCLSILDKAEKKDRRTSAFLGLARSVARPISTTAARASRRTRSSKKVSVYFRVSLQQALLAGKTPPPRYGRCLRQALPRQRGKRTRVTVWLFTGGGTVCPRTAPLLATGDTRPVISVRVPAAGKALREFKKATAPW